jgi:hypothetical protein
LGCAKNPRCPSIWVITVESIKTVEISDNFTGDILPVFFVKDTLMSLHFFRDPCGFSLKAFYDKATEREVKDWHNKELPIFIRMAASDQEFALHINSGEFSSVGGNLHYFEVKDVDRKYQDIVELGETPTEIADLPWMRLFSVTDPGGHKIFFQTANPEWSKGE